MTMYRAIRIALISVLAALALTGSAQAAGGNYIFEGGNAQARTAVKAALDASSFDWDIVPVEVTIHIQRGVRPHSTVGEIWLDPRLLASGRFAWGIVQHEYAHQVAWFAFDKTERTKLTRALGGKDWWYEKPGLAHDDHACERFAATLAYAYWPSSANSEKPEARTGAGKVPRHASRPARVTRDAAKSPRAGADTTRWPAPLA